MLASISWRPVVAVCCASSAWSPRPAVSADVGLADFGGSLALTNDYIYHGLSQTCGDPAAQADLHYRSSGGESASEVFAGVWGSTGLRRSDCGRAREVDAYAGYSVALGQDSSASFTYSHYANPGGTYTLEPVAGYRYDYDTLEAQWAWLDEVYATLGWTPDGLRFGKYRPHQDRSALSYGLQLHHPLKLAASAHSSAGIGYDEIADPAGAGYGFWNAGVGYTVGPVQIQASYFGTSEPGRPGVRLLCRR